jgi:hypothetical protein
MVAVMLAAHFGAQALLDRNHEQRQLPRTAAESEAWEGKHVVVDRGRTPQGNRYRVEVSRSRDGDLCAFLYVSDSSTATGASLMSGGGGCGDRTLSFSFSQGIVGVAASEITRIDVVGMDDTTTVTTRPLPASVGTGNYFVVVAPVSLVEIEGRDVRGHLVKRVTFDGKG